MILSLLRDEFVDLADDQRDPLERSSGPRGRQEDPRRSIVLIADPIAGPGAGRDDDDDDDDDPFEDFDEDEDDFFDDDDEEDDEYFDDEEEDDDDEFFPLDD
jgi:hypothetical protein